MSKNKFLPNLLVLSVIFVLSAGMFGCKDAHNGVGVIYKSEAATQTKLIKFNTSKASYLATQWSEERNSREAVDTEGEEVAAVQTSDSLVAVVEDENGELKEQNVMELPTKELKLASWCAPQPVREVYKCPYPTIEYEAKGFYTVFAGTIDWWQYTDGTPAPHVGQIMYVKPPVRDEKGNIVADGDVVDILNFENNVKRYCVTWVKENDGEDYIQFDTHGNIFILTKDDEVQKTVVYRYNPMNDKIDGYTLDVRGDVEIRNFRVTRDGKWIFLNAMVRHQENNVYALEVNSQAKPKTMYQFKGEIPEAGKDPTYAVSSIEINPTTNEVYWYVCEYLDNTRGDSGLYVASRSTNGEYSEKKVKRYYSIPWWCLDNAVKKYITGAKANEVNYQALLDFIKNMCNCPKEDVVFSLEYFKNRYVEIRDWDGRVFERDYSPLYAEDDKGNPLTDLAAIEHLFSITIRQYYEGLRDDNQPLFYLLGDYYDHYWSKPETNDEGKLVNGNNGYLENGYTSDEAFPWEKLLINKKTGKPAIEIDYCKTLHPGNEGGIILANDEGVWVMSDYWDQSVNNGKGGNTHSYVFKVTDEKGNFTLEQPGDILDRKFCSSDSCRRKKDTDPWFKKPFAANTTGIAALSIDKKTVYYHKEGVTKDLLANDSHKASIERIYSFNLEDDKLLYNAKTASGYIMVSVNLETGTATELPLTKQVETMMGMWKE